MVEELAWFEENSEEKGKLDTNYGTHSVGTKKANELGIFDMSGNVWEWCNDKYAANYYTANPQNNPKGSTVGKSRVLRSGSWYYNSTVCEVSHRVRLMPRIRSAFYGFRIVMKK
jgi:sulfatase modifying factor 1